MSEELNALIQNSTWTLVPPHPHMNLVGYKWVFRVKQNANGSLESCKARLVVKGFHKKPGIHFDETFSPGIKHITIRTILTIALTHDCPLHQLDVNNTFLHDILGEEFYMHQPPSFANPTCFKQAVFYSVPAWTNLPEKEATWEEWTTLKHRFPEFSSSEEGAFKGEGNFRAEAPTPTTILAQVTNSAHAPAQQQRPLKFMLELGFKPIVEEPSLTQFSNGFHTKNWLGTNLFVFISRSR
ncbi:hypothetical protein RJ640_003033 [Escallonia rubra]|uniref:Reverse transcriptase Ty1/copia-type domain-containing protein n=1 Tax=Escallonia rubra TaxID=112253 RepID=A0AA88RC22_9ASTE|nr:hypothetical protein RJ640_003033 [Escallonia rubra]